MMGIPLNNEQSVPTQKPTEWCDTQCSMVLELCIHTTSCHIPEDNDSYTLRVDIQLNRVQSNQQPWIFVSRVVYYFCSGVNSTFSLFLRRRCCQVVFHIDMLFHFFPQLNVWECLYRSNGLFLFLIFLPRALSFILCTLLFTCIISCLCSFSSLSPSRPSCVKFSVDSVQKSAL